MRYLIDNIVRNGNIVVDANSRVMMESVGISVDIGNVCLEDSIIDKEEQEIYRRNIIPRWLKHFKDIKSDTSRQYVFCDDKECISMIQVLYRYPVWHLFFTFRSCDILGKLPVNILAMSRFAEYLFGMYKLEGDVNIRANIYSAHIFVADYLKTMLSDCKRGTVVTLLISDGKVVRQAINQCYMENQCMRGEEGFGVGEGMGYCEGIHSEISLIIQSLKDGINLGDSVIYSTHSPCSNCAGAIIKSGIKGFYYLQKGDDVTTRLGVGMLDRYGVVNGYFR